MKTFVITIIYHSAQPVAYQVAAIDRSDALRMAWDKYEQVADHIKKITAVLK